MVSKLPALIHYSDSRVEMSHLRSVQQSSRPHFKPQGLWVSCDDFEPNWKTWCEQAEFQLNGLAHRHLVTLVDGSKLIWLKTALDIDIFSGRYADRSGRFDFHQINWLRVADDYQGIIIAPYIWERRLMGAVTYSNCFWYYCWDCASGCIWDVNAIGSVKWATIAQDTDA